MYDAMISHTYVVTSAIRSRLPSGGIIESHVLEVESIGYKAIHLSRIVALVALK